MFVDRRADGTIYGKWTVKQWEGQEELPDDHPDITRKSPAELRNDIFVKIAMLEGTTARGVREFILTSLEREAIALGAQQGMTAQASLTFAYSQNVLYRKAKDIDNAISALRATLA